MVLGLIDKDVLVHSLVTATYFYHGLVSFHVTIQSIWANEIQFIFYWNYRNSYFVLFNYLCYCLIQCIILSHIEWYWRLLKYFFALIVDFPLCYLVSVKLSCKVFLTLLLLLLINILFCLLGKLFLLTLLLYKLGSIPTLLKRLINKPLFFGQPCLLCIVFLMLLISNSLLIKESLILI